MLFYANFCDMKVLLSIVFLFASLATFSQAVINFSDRAHDFGTIKEVNGAVSYDFEFVNAGTAPILIKNVESSCGCTSPQWSRQPVLPGQKGFVKATFDPKDRPGFFDKTITALLKTPTDILFTSPLCTFIKEICSKGKRKPEASS